MAPLTPEQVEEKLAQLRAEVAQMRAREREAWVLVLTFLEEQRGLLGRERATFDRTIAGIKAKLAE